MKKVAFIFFAVIIISCGGNKDENKIESIFEKARKELNAESSTMLERDENVKGQGFRRVVHIDFIDCKNIDLMDRSLKGVTKAFTMELKNNLPGSERIDIYRIKLLKDPNDNTPSKSGFNIREKGFTYNRENLN